MRPGGVAVQAADGQTAQGQAAQTQPVAGVVATGLGRAQAPPADRRKAREAETAYFAGAKRLERDELDAAESEFKRAFALDPGNPDYAIAISVTRQHRVTELVQESAKARRAGQGARAETLLAEARTLDPDNPIVTEHSGEAFVTDARAGQAVQAGQTAGARPGSAATAGAARGDRAAMMAAALADRSWRIEMPDLAGVLKVQATAELESFHLNTDVEEVIRIVAAAYGVHAVFDESIPHRNVKFDLENASYGEAMELLGGMTQTITVPLDETSIFVATDSAENRTRLEHQVEETIYLPGSTTDQMNDMSAVIKNIFNVKQVTIQSDSQSIVVEAPPEVFPAMNRTLEDLMDSASEVMVEIKMYEVDTSRMTNAGATIPTQAGVYNVEQAAAQLVNSNQALVQQAIAQGFISASASNIDIALALLGSGLVQNSMLSSTIGFFGKGLTQTGITASTNTAFKLGQNSSDTRSLDDVQVRVGDRQPATLREGTRYPVTQSTYTSGLSTAASALGNAKINGVSVSSLLSQFTGGSSATIPQVTYEDLGVTLEATPTIQKSGRVNLLLDLKIEGISGGSANGIPVLQNRVFKSDITVADGESAMMVSNVSQSETAAMSGIPGLSELPGFQIPISQMAQKDTGQLVVVVTPHVVRRRSEMFAGPRMVVKVEAVN